MSSRSAEATAKRHGVASEELGADPVEPGARLAVVRLAEAPAAAGGGEGPLDEVAESGGCPFVNSGRRAGTEGGVLNPTVCVLCL